MQKNLGYEEPAVFTSMLVNFETDEKIKRKPSEISSRYMNEDLPPWTFLLIAGQQRQRCYDSMQYYYSNSETFEDWEFLHAADKENADLEADETLNEFKKQNLDDNNNINYCLKENGLIFMDGNYSRAESRRPADDMEAIYNEETGETSVKLWQCLYPIDPNFKMGFVKEGEKSEMESKCTAVCETGHTMLTNVGNQYVGNKPGPENNWAPSNSIESMNKFHTFASPMCKIETEDLVTNHAKSDERFDEIYRSRCDPCVRNGSCASVKRSNYSYQLLNGQSCNSTFRMENTPYVCCQNTQVEEHSLQFLPESSSSFDYDYQFDTLHTTEDKSPYREEKALSNYESGNTTNQTTTASSFPCHYNQMMNQTNIVNHRHLSYTNVSEPISQSDDNHSHFSNLNHTSRDGPPNQGQNDEFQTKGSPKFTCKNESQTLEAVESKSKKLKRGCRLWEYIRNLLLDPCTNPSLIKWEDRNEGTFKLVENKKIAFNWGWKKGNTDMSYEKLSRAMRYYYKKKIFQPVIGKRLVYKFGPNATGWKEDIKPR